MANLKRGFSEPSGVAVLPVARPIGSKRGWTIPYRAIEPLAMTCDALIIFATALLSDFVYSLEFTAGQGHLQQFVGFAAVVAALFIPLASNRDLYTLRELLNLRSQVRRISVNWCGIFLFLTAVAFAMKMGDSFSRGSTMTFAVSGLAGLLLARVGWRIYLREGVAVRRFSSRRIALIAEEALSYDPGLHETLTRHGLQPAQQFALPIGRNDAKRRKDVITEAIKSIRGTDIEEIVLTLNPDNWSKFRSLLSELRALPLADQPCASRAAVRPFSIIFAHDWRHRNHRAAAWPANIVATARQAFNRYCFCRNGDDHVFTVVFDCCHRHQIGFAGACPLPTAASWI